MRRAVQMGLRGASSASSRLLQQNASRITSSSLGSEVPASVRRLSGDAEAGSDLLNAPLDGVTIVRSAEAARKVVDILEKLPVDVHHAWDTEVSEIDVATQSPVGNGKVICASFYSGPEIDFGTGPRVWIDNLGDANGTLGVFKEFLEDPARKKVFHNVGFDRHVLYNEGIDMVGLSADTMHMARVWSTSRSKQGGYSLETLSNDLLGHRKVPMKERFSKPKLKKDGTPGKDRFLPGVDEIQLGAETRAAWIDYSTYDAEATWHLRENLAEKLTQMPWAQDRSMLQFYEQYIVPFAMLLTDMERAGIRVDVETHMPQAETQALKDKEKHTSEFLRWARKFQPDIKRMNIGSDAQKAQFLFAPACRSNGRAPRALEAAKKRTLAKFGPQRPASGEHPVPDPNRNGGALDAADWMEWLDPEGKLYHPETHEWADPDSWPPGRPFKVDNEEGYIEPGKTKAKKQRDLWIRGLGIPPVEVTAGGWPAASGAVLKELAGDVEAVPPRYGKALEHFGGGCEGEKACSAIHSLVSVGAIDTMLSNFILPLQQMVDGDSRVHCSMNLNTDTGRLSARRPNLQNQPALEKVRRT
jgi:DNA polymerase-1